MHSNPGLYYNTSTLTNEQRLWKEPIDLVDQKRLIVTAHSDNPLPLQVHTAMLAISQVYSSFPANSSPQKFLGIMLRVAFEERHFGPDSWEHLMRADDRPLAGPHHTQQCTQLIGQTSVIDNNTLDDIY